MAYRFLYVFFFCLSLYAQEDPFYELATIENDPSSLVEGMVSAITGAVYLVEEDMVVQGQEPIRIYRTYCGYAADEKPNWSILPHTKIEHTYYGYEITEPSGARFTYSNAKAQKFKIGKEKYEKLTPIIRGKSGYTNTARGKISGYFNVQNSYAIIDSEKQKCLTLHCADGTIRTYKRIHHEKNFLLSSEKLSNGNCIFYTYDRKNRIETIKTTNPSNTVCYARAQFCYLDSEACDVIGSDSQKVEYRFSEGYLTSKKCPYTPNTDQNFSTKWLNYDEQWQPRLQSIVSPLDRFKSFTYYENSRQTVADQLVVMEDIVQQEYADGHCSYYWDPRRSRVSSIQAPVGQDKRSYETSKFIYDLKAQNTTVYDASNNRTIYSWDEDLRLTKIEHFLADQTPHAAQQFIWSREGDLLCKNFLDGKGNVLVSHKYIYSSFGDVIEEKLFGNLSGKGKIVILNSKGLPEENGVECNTTRFFYDARHFLIKKEESNGKVTAYQYIADTTLPSAQFIGHGDQIKIRKFWEYNQDLILIKEIQDDGTSNDPKNLTGVKTRKITEITPSLQKPYIGMPSIIEEKYEENGILYLLRKTILSYTLGGRIAQKDIYDSNGDFQYSLKTTYNEKGAPKEQTNALGQTTTFSYDLCNNLKCIKEPFKQKSTLFDYDHSNRLTLNKKIGDDGVILETRYTYDKKHNLTREEGPFGYICKNSYDLFRNLIKKETPYLDQEFSTTQYQHDSANRTILEIDPNRAVTKTAYNAYSRPIRIEHPDGGIEQFTYYLDGSLKTSIDPEGIETTFEYDFLSRELSKTISFQGTIYSRESSEYDAFHLIAKTDAENNRKTFKYDGAGRLISEELANEETLFFYDSLNRPSKEQKGTLVHLKKYDHLDRVIEERKEDLQGSIFTQVFYEFDPAGNQSAIIRSIDGSSTQERFIYDSMDRQIQKIDPLGHITQTQFEDLQYSLKETTRNPLGLQTSKTYDASQKLKMIEIQNNQGDLLSQQKYMHDRNGNIIEETSSIFDPPRKIQLQKTYDSMNRLIKQTVAAGSPDERTTLSRYNKKGALIETVKPDQTSLTYTYSPLGHLATCSSSDGSIDYFYTHDRLGRMLQSIDRLTKKSTFCSYDPKGRLLQEILAHGAILSSQYDLMGRRTQLIFPDTSSLQYEYDPLFLTHITRYSPSKTPLYTHTMSSYDLSGNSIQEELIGNLGFLQRKYNLCGQVDFLTTLYTTHEVLKRDPLGYILEANLNENRSIYTYDDLSQLTSEQGNCTHTYSNDAHYCRLKKDTEDYEINTLLQIPSHISYDLNGNPKTQRDKTYTFDALDRLIRIETPLHTLVFTYDSDHRRLSKTTYALKDGSIQQIDHQLYLYDGQNEIGAIDANGEIQELRILGSTTHAEIGATIAIELAGKTYAPIHDLMGNITSLISLETTLPVVSYSYSAFGEERSTNSFYNPWRYSSKRIDSEIGLIYYGRRFYDPSFGRWLTPDPAGYTDGLNLYAYVHNNPINHFDLYGLLDYGQWDPDWNRETQESWASAAETIANVGIGIVESLAALVDWDDAKLADSDIPINLDQVITTNADNTRSWVHENRYLLGEVARNLIAVGAVGKVCDSFIRESTVVSKAITVGVKYNRQVVAQNLLNERTTGISQIIERPATSAVSAAFLKNKLIAKEIAGGHAFEKHVLNRGEFPGISRYNFEKHILDILNGNKEMKNLARGRVAWWDQKSGTVIIRDSNRIDGGTAFRPTGGYDYFSKELK